MLEAYGAFQSTADYIRNAYTVADYWKRALEVNPRDAAALHLLGRWCLGVYETPFWKRQLASALFAEPPTVSAIRSSGDLHFSDIT